MNKQEFKVINESNKEEFEIKVNSLINSCPNRSWVLFDFQMMQNVNKEGELVHFYTQTLVRYNTDNMIKQQAEVIEHQNALLLEKTL